MLVEGHKLLTLIGEARNGLILCAPFIKEPVLKKLLESVADDVSVKIVTRWRAEEVACGVSDLEVYDLVSTMSNVSLYLLDSLHAKVYVADQTCLVGSANLTGTALGWSAKPNVELLASVHIGDEDVQFLLTQLKFAREASEHERNIISSQAQALDVGFSIEDLEMNDKHFETWLPSCASPKKLYGIYSDPNAEKWVEESVESALSDLEVLATPAGLNSGDFVRYIALTLYRMPAFKTVIDKIPSGIKDIEGVEFVMELKKDYERVDAQKHWEIIQDWIRVFFVDRFEVVPDSYLVRLKQ